MFAGTGRFSSRIYMRMFLPGTISRGKISVFIHDKNCRAFAGVTVDSVPPQKLSPRTLSANGKCLPGHAVSSPMHREFCPPQESSEITFSSANILSI